MSGNNKMTEFPGFPGGKTGLTRIPDIFILELLPRLGSLWEVKVILYAFWKVDKSEGPFRFLRLSDFTQNESFMQGLAENPTEANERLNGALKLACEQKILLEALPPGSRGDTLFFFNTPKGRAAVLAVQSGKWTPDLDSQPDSGSLVEPKDIFRLYEENIGIITPLISDSLQEAEKTYPKTWIEDAVAIAVMANKRSWNYINAILKRWQVEGKNDREDRRDSEENYRRYIEGEFKDFIEH